MSILRANLRLFWERWSFWILYFFILSTVTFSVVSEWAQYCFLGRFSVELLSTVLTLGVLPIGLIVGAMQVEILSCPLALTLPGHQRVVRQVVFTVGSILSLAVTLIVLPGITRAGSLVLGSWATFSASLVVYLVGVGLTYVIPRQALIAVATFAWFMFDPGSGRGFDEAAPHIILGFPISVIVVSFLSAAVAWLCLKRPAWGLQINVSWREWLLRRWRRGRIGQEIPAASVSNPLFLRLVRASRGPSAARCIWGALYGWMVPGGGRGQLVLTPIAALACAVLALYVPVMGFVLIMYLPFSFPRPSLYSKLPITGGRRERFLATLVLLIIAGGVWTISVAVSFAAVDLVQAYLPQVQTRAANLEQIFPPVNIRLAVFLTALYPLRAFVDLVFQGLPTHGKCSNAVLFLFVYLPILFTQRWLTGMPLVCVPLALVASWLVSMYGLYQITMRRDLVIDRPDELPWSWPLMRHGSTELPEQGESASQRAMRSDLGRK